MIQMLSRFNLKRDTDFETFERNYYEFFERVKRKGLVETTGKIGQRISDTPMDTDAEDAQKYYVLMSFSDRNQMDQAYEYISSPTADKEDLKPHSEVKLVVCDSVFTCWQE